MTDFLSGTFNIMPQSQAQWDADDRVLRSDTVALVTDGPNKGKHKIGRGAPYTFADLDYVEDASGGGISDGDTLSIGLTFPQNGLKSETPSGDVLSINANGTQTDDRTLSIDIGDSDKQLAITGDATISGTNTGDVKTLTTHWREWAGDNSIGSPASPSTLNDLMNNFVGLDLEAAENTGVRVALSMPSDYGGEEIEVVLKGVASEGNGGNVRIYCKAVIVAPSSKLSDITANGAIPTPNTVSMAPYGNKDAFATSFTITPSGDAWTSGCQLVLLMGREGANVGDTHTDVVQFTSATINW